MADMGPPLDRFREVETGEPFTPQNPRLLKIELSETSVMARNGSMVAYQGDVRFEHKGGGLGRLLKKAATGEQLRLMHAVALVSAFAQNRVRRARDEQPVGQRGAGPEVRGVGEVDVVLLRPRQTRAVGREGLAGGGERAALRAKSRLEVVGAYDR